MHSEKIYLCFDYGTKKIGVAIGNNLSCQARPLEIIQTIEKNLRFARIESLIREWQPDELVVGLPLDVDGSDQLSTTQSRRFARQLEGRFQLPVILQDERYSSLQAQDLLGNHNLDDAMAACVILQRFLDTL